MNLNLSLSGQDESRLQKQASAAGQNVEAFVLHLVEEKLAGTVPNSLSRGMIGGFVGFVSGFLVTLGLLIVNRFFVAPWLAYDSDPFIPDSYDLWINLVGSIAGAAVGAALAYRSRKRLRLLFGFLVGLLAGPSLGVALALLFFGRQPGHPPIVVIAAPLFGLIGLVIGPVIGTWVATRRSRR